MKHPPYHLRVNKEIDRFLLVEIIGVLKEYCGISDYTLKWTHCRVQNNGKISKIIESHRHSFSRNRPQPALHNRDSGEVVGDYRNGYNELIHRKELVPSGTVSDKHLHT